jgi:SAM-dependent methyltransferase
MFESSYYAGVYRNYELQNPSHKLRYYHSLVRDAVAGEGTPTVHDLGCAFGLFIGTAPDHWRRSASDTSAYAVDAARRRYPDVSFEVSDGLIARSEVGLDIVTAFDVLEHIPDLPHALCGIAKQLRDGGVLVAVVPVYDGPLGPLVRWLDRDPTHVHKESRRFWMSVLSTDFTFIRKCGITRYLFPGGHYAHFAAAWTFNVAPAIALVCKKRSLR